MGRLGLGHVEMYNLTPRAFFNLLNGYYDAKNEDIKFSWEQTRWLAFLLLQPHAEKNKLNKPQDIVRFDWEIPKEAAEITDKHERFIKKWDAEK